MKTTYLVLLGLLVLTGCVKEIPLNETISTDTIEKPTRYASNLRDNLSFENKTLLIATLVITGIGIIVLGSETRGILYWLVVVFFAVLVLYSLNTLL